MTAQGIAAKQNDVRRQQQRTETNAEFTRARERIGKPHCLPDVVRKKDEKKKGEVQKVSVDVLDDQRKRALPAVAFARLSDGAVERIGPECLVVRPAVVVTGNPEPGGKWKDQERR